MKTTFTFTVLALTIQAMVNAQTAGNQTHQIRMDLNGTKPLSQEQTAPAQSNYLQLLDEQIKQSDALASAEQKLKEEITATQQKRIQKQIAVSRLKSHIVHETFNNNDLRIKDLLTTPSLKPFTIQKSTELSREASRAFQLSKEIREEADAQPTPEAQLAEMSNAEEKEILALAKQQEVIELLKHATPLYIKKETEFATQALPEKQATPLNASPAKDDLEELTGQAMNLKNTCDQLRASATDKTGHEKEVILEEALALEQEYIAARINIALWRYRKTEKTFLENRQFIELLFTGIGDEALTQKARQLHDEANYLFRLGKEMREEANAQATPLALLGEISNAEEKETLALNKQQQTVSALKRLNPKGLLLAVN